MEAAQNDFFWDFESLLVFLNVKQFDKFDDIENTENNKSVIETITWLKDLLIAKDNEQTVAKLIDNHLVSELLGLIKESAKSDTQLEGIIQGIKNHLKEFAGKQTESNICMVK